MQADSRSCRSTRYFLQGKFLERAWRSIESQNILYFRAYETQIFYYKDEKIIDTAIMKNISQYDHLLKGPLTYKQFLNNQGNPNFWIIQKINSTLNLSRFALEQKVRIFLFSKPSSLLLCRISICTQNDQYRYTVFYTEITKPHQKNSHVKFKWVLFIVILAVCIHFKTLK